MLWTTNYMCCSLQLWDGGGIFLNNEGRFVKWFVTHLVQSFPIPNFWVPILRLRLIKMHRRDRVLLINEHRDLVQDKVLRQESWYLESKPPFFTLKRHYLNPNFDEDTAENVFKSPRPSLLKATCLILSPRRGTGENLIWSNHLWSIYPAFISP